MAFPRLPLILAAVVMLRRVDGQGGCVEDNCYKGKTPSERLSLYWNPAGAEECSEHFVTTVVPAPMTATVTITSNIADITTITGAPIATGVIIPFGAIPTYIVRACYGDISYRFESACSCIEAGPTTTIIAQPTITNTVIFPLTAGPGSVLPPFSPLPPASPVVPVSPPSPFLPQPLPTLPASGSLPLLSGLAEPTCVPIPGPVIVTVQVDTLYMTLTMAGSTLCIGNTTSPPAPSSGCNCPSSVTLSSSAPVFSSSVTWLANTASSTSSGSFSTVLRTSFAGPGFSNISSAVATSGPSTSEEQSTSTPARNTFVTSQDSVRSTADAPSTESSLVEPSSTELSPSPSSIEEVSSTADAESSTVESSNVGTSTPVAAESSTAEPSSTETSESAPSSTLEPLSSSVDPLISTLVPSTTTTASSQTPSTGISTSATAGPTHFIPHGPVVLLQVASGTLQGQYIASDQPTEDRPTNLRSHTTADTDLATVWTLDAPTGILFQQISDGDGDWWGAWFGFGSRSQWSSIQMLPADTVVSWLVLGAPVSLKAPLRCVIDYTASNVISCGQQLWTRLVLSDKCGWAVTTPFNPTYAAACPGSEELVLEAILVNPEEEGIS
ncbi:hypothetical protein DHEL01_v204306 [Diaporthe helianthi]|uniref:Uncharacterized protein n=1 Tax=Diaporthe helianthi TaxID=158607 RepID=A0A2P5I4A5_DIAHE|nr:hypothetical protein DHEL01_v204306 [Diaporthe helianthi]